MVSGKPERWFRHKDVSWGGVLGLSHWEEAWGQNQDTLERLLRSTSDRLIYRDVTAMGHFIVYRGESLVGMNKFYF